MPEPFLLKAEVSAFVKATRQLVSDRTGYVQPELAAICLLFKWENSATYRQPAVYPREMLPNATWKTPENHTVRDPTARSQGE